MDPTTLMALGAAGGGLLGGLGGSKQAGTVTTTTDVPEWLKPFVMGFLDPAKQQFQQSVGAPSPVPGVAQDEILKTIRGDYLDPTLNPFLGKTFEEGAARIRSSLSPAFGHMQAFGPNTAFNQALGRSLSDFGTGLFGGNFQQERNRQFGATMGAPGFSSGVTESTFAPFNQYANLLRGWGSQQQQPYFRNKGAEVLGGALTGGALARVFK